MIPSDPERSLALSIRQPWAALLITGRKKIEIRRWSTAIRGRILIHAARLPDDRPEAWAWVTDELQPLTEYRGGLIGVAELTDCIRYADRESFQRDHDQHLNQPDWFQPPTMYGFTFANPQPIPFESCPGHTRFFSMDGGRREDGGEDSKSDDLSPVLRPTSPALLVSVRGASEAEAALAGGAGVIDVKEPTRGSLGRADPATVREVIAEVAGRAPVSAALGEWCEPLPATWCKRVGPGLSWVKCGLAGAKLRADFPQSWLADRAWFGSRLAEMAAVAYADWQRADAPAPAQIVELAIKHRFTAFLIDTWEKDGSSLLDWCEVEEVVGWCERLREAGILVALAGSLGEGEIQRLTSARPHWFAVRGAVCQGGRRGDPIDVARVRHLTEVIRELTTVSPT